MNSIEKRLERLKNAYKRDLTANEIKREKEIYKILEMQAGSCPICKSKFDDKNKWRIDQPSKKSKIRGLLCKRCDDGIRCLPYPEYLLSAAHYLTSNGFEKILNEQFTPSQPEPVVNDWFSVKDKLSNNEKN